MGVWIEIAIFRAFAAFSNVTPLVGVWIEIYQLNSGYQVLFSSLPSWECGLKSCYNDYNESTLYVTPLVGVWIEILIRAIKSLFFCRHSPRGSVD